MGNTCAMVTEQDAAILTFPNHIVADNVGNAFGGELADIEMVLRENAERLNQLSARLDRHLQHGRLDQLDDPFAVTAEIGDRIDRAYRDATLAADHALKAITMWQSAWNREQPN